MNKIGVLVLNNLVNDSRVLKEVNSLSKKYQVDVFCFRSQGQPSLEENGNSKVYRTIKYNREYSGPFRKIYQAFIYLKYFFYVIYKLNRYNVVHCNDLETLPHGVIAKIFNRKLKVVYDAHEYETETLWMQNKLKKFLAKKIEGFLIKFSDLNITVSNSIAEEYVRLYNVAKPKIVLNTPLYKKVEKNNLFREIFNIPQEKKIFLYQGGLTGGRGIEIILEAFKILVKCDSVIVFMGYGALDKKIIKTAKRYENIFYHPAVKQDVLLNYTSSADFGLSLIEDRCLNYRYCLPNKIFEYTMAELPIITSNLPEMNNFVKQYSVGVVAHSNQPIELKEAILKLLKLDIKALHENLQFTKKIFNWEAQEKVLLTSYNNILNEKI
ncbi:MAG: glycosyltransferase involved in cell wall biosynthesis [Planctomycetota bacterium]|jgi:glycosyltransferase involved in cell wall biosynthesis